MNEQERKLRAQHLPIATVEHHAFTQPKLSTHDMAERVARVWREVEGEAESGALSLGVDCIMAINRKIAVSFDSEPGLFLDEEEWPGFVKACGSINDAPGQVLSWIFSALYWRHLTRFRFATAWLYINALRIQNGLPAQYLTMETLGPCLESLSGSGPPLFDGQTFYPDDYSKPFEA